MEPTSCLPCQRIEEEMKRPPVPPPHTESKQKRSRPSFRTLLTVGRVAALFLGAYLPGPEDVIEQLFG